MRLEDLLQFFADVIEHVEENYFDRKENIEVGGGKKVYKGHISWEEFKLSRKCTVSRPKHTFVVATGSLVQDHEMLRVTTILSIKSIVISLLILVLFFAHGNAIVDAYSENCDDYFQIITFLLLHGTLIGLIPYFLMRFEILTFMNSLNDEFQAISNRN